MEEKKLTDEEIIKALYICTTADDDMDCSDGCPMYEEDYCTTKLLKLAFDLIQRLQGKVADIEMDFTEQQGVIFGLEEEKRQLQEENAKQKENRNGEK